MKIVFITSGGLEMGMGHVYRSISLAEEIAKFGNKVDIHFLTKSNDIVINKIKNSGFKVIRPKDYEGELELLKKINPNVVIIDRLNVQEYFVKAIRRSLDPKIVIFDNVSSANKYADVIVNAIVGSNFRNRKFWDSSTNSLYFYGPRYLILKREFYKYKKKKKTDKEKKILLIFGGSDPSNLTSKILNRIMMLKQDLDIEIILGPYFIYFDELNKILEKNKAKRERIKIYKDVKNVADKMHNVDLVITSPGLSMFEALYIGTPVIAICQNLLQKDTYSNFFPLINANEINNFSDFLDSRFLISPEEEYIKDLYIGKGKKEVIEAITNLNPMSKDKTISLRQAVDDDLELMMAWRSNPFVYEGFYLQNRPLKWEEHYSWWKSRDNRVDWIISLHGEEHSRDVGSVNVSFMDNDTPEIGIYIGEVTLWGRGVARSAISLVINWLKILGYKIVRARIMKLNIKSLKLFEGLGFKKIGEGRKGEWVYELNLSVHEEEAR